MGFYLVEDSACRLQKTISRLQHVRALRHATCLMVLLAIFATRKKCYDIDALRRCHRQYGQVTHDTVIVSNADEPHYNLTPGF